MSETPGDGAGATPPDGTGTPEYLEALLRLPSVPAEQALVIEHMCTIHRAWFEGWVAHGFTPQQAFDLVRVMVREGCRS